MGNAEFTHDLFQLIGFLAGTIEWCVRQDADEFLTTIACNDIMRTIAVGLDCGSDRVQANITCLMSIEIVVALEEIDINHDQSQRPLDPHAAAPFGLDRDVELTSVGDPGEAVGQRQ